MLSTLITSKARQKIIKYFYTSGISFEPHTRKIAKDLSLEINAVRRELIHLTSAKILNFSKRGNRTHYFLNVKSRLYYDLAALVSKEEGLFSQVYKNRKKLGKVSFAVGSLAFFLKQPQKESEIDLLIVGDVYTSVLESIIKKYEKKENTEVNYMQINLSEFNLLKDRKDPLLIGLLISPRSIFIGNQKKFLD